MIKVFVFGIFLTIGTSFGFDPEKHKNWNLLPHHICGEVSNTRIVGGEEAPMNNYPWLAMIGYYYNESLKIKFFCGGALVTSTTVLSAAHCFRNRSNKYVLRFGEHNIKTDPDCIEDFCADPVIDILPSQILIRPDFSLEKLNNDISLIRLINKIEFSDFISPICLGGREFMKQNFLGTIAEVAGWGIYDIVNRLTSSKLRFVKMPVVDNKKCVETFETVLITEKQLCVGGQIGVDSCSGDSGGPLMKVYDGPNGPRYYLLGIVSFGTKRCGLEETPAVYTKLSKFTEWVLDNLAEKSSNSIDVKEF